MATQTTTNLSDEYQTYFSKEMLTHAIQATILNQFALKAQIPKNYGAGGATITPHIKFFRRSAAVNNSSGRVAAVQAITEGTAISVFKNVTLTPVTCSLAQIGEATKITDIVNMTSLFDALDMNIAEMAEDFALDADNITRNVLVAGSVAGNKRYAGGATSFGTLNALSQSAGKVRIIDFIAGATKLKLNRAPRFQGHYIAAIPCEIGYDLQNDPDWINVNKYNGGGKQIYIGEIGMFGGCRFVEHTNPQVETSSGAEGTYADPGAVSTRVLVTFIFGKGAYGVPMLEGEKVPAPKTEATDEPDDRAPVKIEILIADKPDKSDPLNQFMTAGWKSFWNAKELNTGYYQTLRSKTEFA